LVEKTGRRNHPSGAARRAHSPGQRPLAWRGGGGSVPPSPGGWDTGSSANLRRSRSR